MKIVLITLCILLNSFVCQADSDTNIKNLLSGQKITVEKGVLFDKKEKIDISKINNFKVVGKETKPFLPRSSTIALVKFKYNYNTGIPCAAAVTYTWTTIKGPLAPNQLENIVVYCEP